MSKEKIQQLLKAVGSEPAEDTTQVEATEYNWNEPRYFNSEQHGKLDSFSETVAEAMALKLSKFCRSEFNMTVASTTQHYVHEFAGTLSEDEQKDYYIPFGSGQEHMFGLISISEQTAFSWAKQLLGDSETEKEPEAELSKLEESLLLDLVSDLVEAFSGCDESLVLHSAKSIVKGQWPLELEDTEELCKISFEVKKTESESSSGIYFLILCSKLAPVAGKVVDDSVEYSAANVSKAILGHLDEIPIQITGQLASTMITFEEVMNLQADDILVLDKKIDQPAELIIDGRPLYYGCPAKSGGKYAVAITNMAAEFGDNT